MQPGDHQQVDRARELKGLGFFRIELLAEPQQDGRRQVRLLRTEIIGKDLPAADPQRFQQPRGAVGGTGRHHGNRFRIIHPQVAGDAAAAIEGRAIGLARVQGMFGRQEMGKGPEAIARGQIRNQALDDHGRAAGSGPPLIAVANRPQFHLEADLVARSRRPQGIELRLGNDPRRLQGHGLDANRLLLRAGEQAQVVAAEEVPAAMVPGRGQGQCGQEQHDRCGHVPPLAPEAGTNRPGPLRRWSTRPRPAAADSDRRPCPQPRPPAR